MQTEDDTFSALKKWSYKEVEDHWFRNYSLAITMTTAAQLDGLLQIAGWTYEEFHTAYVQQTYVRR